MDEYFNASTGEGDEGETDHIGPWNKGNGLHIVQSEMLGGVKGLNTEPYSPQPGTEVTSRVDATPVGKETGGEVLKIDRQPKKKVS